jgi:hypothetical protein
MKRRSLRIAWSVAWGLVAVLLVALWVRSYWKLDGISGDRGSEFIYFDVFMGRAYYSRSSQEASLPARPQIPWHFFDNPIVDTDLTPRVSDSTGSHHFMGSGWNVFANGWEISLALWWPVLISGVLATAAWTRQKWQFSLRTFLIAMTLVAAVLGLIVWLTS